MTDRQHGNVEVLYLFSLFLSFGEASADAQNARARFTLFLSFGYLDFTTEGKPSRVIRVRVR